MSSSSASVTKLPRSSRWARCRLTKEEMSRVLAIAVVVASAVLAVLFAQPPDQLPVPTFRTEANYVRVDVFPTRDGAPIADLAATDFEVLEDRVPQKIEQFERVVIRAAGSGE